MGAGCIFNPNTKGNIMGYTLQLVKRYQEAIKKAQLALSAPIDFHVPVMMPAGVGGDWNKKRPSRKLVIYRQKRRIKNRIAKMSRRKNR